MKMFKKYFLLFFMATSPVVYLSSVYAQNTPMLDQTEPAGSYTGIVVPLEIGAAVNSRNTITNYMPKVKITNENLIESASLGQVNKSIEYRDGSNQVYQTIIFSNSRNTNNYPMDLVQPVNTRTEQDKYSFLPFPRINANSIQPDAFEGSKYYYLGLYPDEGYTSYAAEKYISDAGYREIRSYAPGKSQIGQNRYTAQRTITNDDYDVANWVLDANGAPDIPNNNRYYPANTLFGVEVTDPEGHKVISYKNKSGQLIVKRVQDGADSFADTYYIYDDMGRLVYILPPKAIEAAASTGSLSAAVLNNLCFQYVYDNKGRLQGQRSPGQNGLTEIVYDRLQRPVMRQTPNLKNEGKWEVTFYDHSGRVIATSIYTSPSSRTDWQDLFDNYTGGTYTTNDIQYYILSDQGAGIYPPETGIDNNTMMSYTWYDDYSVVDPNNTVYNNLTGQLNFTADLLSIPGSETPARSALTHGLVTGTKVRILPAPGIDTAAIGEWNQTWNYYDDKGQLIYAVSKDLHQGNMIHQHLTGTQYDFTGKVILSKHIMTNERSMDGVTEHVELTRNEYDAVTDQLLKVYHKVDNGSWTTLATYKYDELGRLKRESLGEGGEVRDYSYNIRGQLTGINGEYAETGDKGGKNTTFGESLKYDYGFSTPRHDGKITGMVWRGSGGANTNALSYGYTYDPAGRLTHADFKAGDDQSGLPVKPSGWNNNDMDYTVSNLTYDKNSNILTKNMMGSGQTGPDIIDELTYSYGANSNQILSVSDGITQDYGNGDFQDGNTSGNDYAYDDNGNLTKDLNKGITNITYTWFNKPQKITFENGSEILYSYTAGGSKVQEKVQTDETKVTDYIGNFVYQDNMLQYASTPVGRTVWNSGTVKEEYFVKDHLGNVRSIIDVYKYPILEYMASYEIASAQLEGMFFDKIDEIREGKPASNDPNDSQAGRLNGAEADKRIGTSILLKVMSGDRVKLSVDNYYDGSYNQEDDSPVSPEEMMEAIISTLTGGEGGLGGSESHNSDLVPELFNPENFNQINDMLYADVTPDQPKAFLNYVLFDENMQVVSNFTGAWQADGNGGWQTIGNDEPMDIPMNGYLAVYLSNTTSIACANCASSSGDVWFDKLKIEFTRGNLKEENHYYPFGLPMAGIGGQAMGAQPNRQKYQSNEYIKDAGLNWMSFGARQYDPQLGRFLSVDPLADEGGQDRLSPYHAMGNNPVSLVDPGGMLIFLSDGLPKPGLVSVGISTPSTTIEGYTGGLSPQALKDMAGIGNYTTDAMGMLDWGGGSEVASFLAAVKEAGGVILTITGNQPLSSRIIANLIMNIGNAGGGGGEEEDEKENGDGSSLYETPNGEPARTPQEWAEHYEGMNWDEITTENKGKHGDGYQRYLGGLIKFRLGPNVRWRYVKLDNGMILDMRHVLVVGMKTHGGFKTGDKLGIFGEIGQLITDRKSAMAKQDYISNFVGEQFLGYLEKNSPYYNPRNSTRNFGNVHETNISRYFYNFISNISFK